jgi:hypothetical protein
MSTVWKFEHTVKVRASRGAAWAYWSNVANWAEVDPAVEWARIDGAFEAGSRGETKPIGAPANAWTLADVEAGRRAVIAMSVPGAEVRFAWSFGDGPDAGAVLTQVVEVLGDDLKPFVEALDAMAEGIPLAMLKLATAIDRYAAGPPS